METKTPHGWLPGATPWPGAPPDEYPLSSNEQVLVASIVIGGGRRCFGFQGFNSNAAARFILGFDAAALPADGAVPLFVVNAAATSAFSAYFGSVGRWFYRGIVLCTSTTSTTKTIAAAEALFDVQFYQAMGIISGGSSGGGTFNGGTITDALLIDDATDETALLIDSVSTDTLAIISGNAASLAAIATLLSLRAGNADPTLSTEVLFVLATGQAALYPQAGNTYGLVVEADASVALPFLVNSPVGTPFFEVRPDLPQILAHAPLLLRGANTVPASASMVAGDCALWYDSTSGASKLMVKAKQADGTVKTAAIALA